MITKANDTTNNSTETSILTTKELASRLKVGTRTAYSLMHNSAFPSVRLGRKFIVTEEALTKWLRANENRSFIL